MTFDLSARLAERHTAHLYRQRPLLDSPQGPEVVVDGQRLLAFCSNDYLGLANHSHLKFAAMKAIEEFGVGAGASRLISGTLTPHHNLERDLAQ